MGAEPHRVSKKGQVFGTRASFALFFEVSHVLCEDGGGAGILRFSHWRAWHWCMMAHLVEIHGAGLCLRRRSSGTSFIPMLNNPWGIESSAME